MSTHRRRQRSGTHQGPYHGRWSILVVEDLARGHISPQQEEELLPRGGKSALDPAQPLGAKAARLAREEGVIVRGIRDLIALSPPFIITHDEVDQLFAAVRRTLERLWQ